MRAVAIRTLVPAAIAGVWLGLSPAFAFDCPKPVDPLVDLSGVSSFYGTESTQSVIDPQRAANYYRLTWQYDALLDRMLTFSEVPKGTEVLDCALEQLELWASSGALTEGISAEPGVERRQAAMIQAWVLSGTAALLAQFEPATLKADARFASVSAWMNGLAHRVHNEFEYQQGRPDWLNRTSNHSHWAGLAMLRVGLLTDDRDLIGAGLAERDAALEAIADDGSLPAEMARGARSLSYTNFALSPMLALVELASRHGSRLSTDQLRRVERAIAFGVAANTNVAMVSDRIGTKQVDFDNPGALAWVPIAARLGATVPDDLTDPADTTLLDSKYLGKSR